MMIKSEVSIKRNQFVSLSTSSSLCFVSVFDRVLFRVVPGVGVVYHDLIFPGDPRIYVHSSR